MSLTIAPGDIFAIAPDTRYFGDPVEVGGELEISGQLTVTDATAVTASGVGTGLGSAPPSFSPFPIAAAGAGSGVGSAVLDGAEVALTAPGVGRGDGTAPIAANFDISARGRGDAQADPDPLSVPVGDSIVTPIGTDREAGRLLSGGTTFVGGTLFVSGRASPPLREVLLTGLGEGLGIGDASVSKVVPAVRQDSIGIEYDETEEIALNTDG